MAAEENYLGYIKYDGKKVERGLLDARKASIALLGLDQAVRHFVNQQSSELRTADYEIPVSIDKGSWIAAIPADIGTICGVAFGIAATAYLTTAANKMAEKDFADVGMKDIFRHALSALIWTVKIAKHLGGFIQKGFENPKFQDNGEMIGIQNTKGEYIFVPRKYFDMYLEANPNVLQKLVSNVEADMDLLIVAEENGELTKVTIDQASKYIFVEDEPEPEDILFPELRHGDLVNLHGEVTRENKTTNSLGFKYDEHILTAYPDDGNIVPYKDMLFEDCTIEAIVDRRDELGRVGSRKPKLIFSRLKPARKPKPLL
jgi:hypothetical protein